VGIAIIIVLNGAPKAVRGEHGKCHWIWAAYAGDLVINSLVKQRVEIAPPRLPALCELKFNANVNVAKNTWGGNRNRLFVAHFLGGSSPLGLKQPHKLQPFGHWRPPNPNTHISHKDLHTILIRFYIGFIYFSYALCFFWISIWFNLHKKQRGTAYVKS